MTPATWRRIPICYQRHAYINAMLTGVCLSVCPSVHHASVLYQNGLTYSRNPLTVQPDSLNSFLRLFGVTKITS